MGFAHLDHNASAPEMISISSLVIAVVGDA
jgi:hypothetical protein